MAALFPSGAKLAWSPLTGKVAGPHIAACIGCWARLRDGFAAPRPESETMSLPLMPKATAVWLIDKTA